MFTLAQDGTVESLLSNILVALDSYEVGEIKAKMLRGRLAKAEQGGYAGGRVPYGYTCQRHTKQLVLYEPEAEAVRTLFILFAQNPGTSYRELASLLTEWGYRCRNGKPFSVSLVYNILHRIDFYLLGRYRYAGIEVQGQQPTIFAFMCRTYAFGKTPVLTDLFSIVGILQFQKAVKQMFWEPAMQYLEN